jgi:ribose-phosphate pyrophosphokinase
MALQNGKRSNGHTDGLVKVNGGVPPELRALINKEVEAALSAAQPRNRFLIVAHPSMAHIKDALIQHDPSTYDEVRVNWHEFESGMPNIFIEEVHRLQPAHILLLLNLRQKEILLDQLSLLYAIPRYGCAALTVLLPFYPTGTMERVDREGEVATASTLSRMLSATPPTAGGPVRFVIFDIHALQIRFYFQDSILPVLLSAMPLLLNLLKSRYANDDVAIAFPDEGAKKRFGGFFEKGGYPVLYCSKVREGDKRVVKIAEGNPRDQHVFIVDDLCNTGGTVIACQKALRAGGAKKVSVFVTHGVFPQESWKKFETAGFDKIFVTDSIPETCDEFCKLKGVKGDSCVFEVITMAPAIHEYLQGQVCYEARRAWRA